MRRWIGGCVAMSVALAIIACGDFSGDAPLASDDARADEPSRTDDASTGDARTADAPESGPPSKGAVVVDPATGLPLDMVRIEAATPFFIDAHEASVNAYNAVRDAHPWESLDLPNACHGPAHAKGWGDRSTCFTPGTQGATTEEQPVNCVDWCDALAFCVAQNKRLCGQTGGAPFPATSAQNIEDAPLDTASDEWTFACGGPDGFAQPYGDELQTGNCNDSAPNIVKSGEFTACVGSVDGLHDMSGNLNEWEAACTTDDEAALCLARGGAYRSGQQGTGCFFRRNGGFPVRTGHYDDVGIRCCADIPR